MYSFQLCLKQAKKKLHSQKVNYMERYMQTNYASHLKCDCLTILFLSNLNSEIQNITRDRILRLLPFTLCNHKNQWMQGKKSETK